MNSTFKTLCKTLEFLNFESAERRAQARAAPAQLATRAAPAAARGASGPPVAPARTEAVLRALLRVVGPVAQGCGVADSTVERAHV